LAFSLAILQMIVVHDGLNVGVSLQVLLYQFVSIFLVYFFYVGVNKCLFLLF
jgi:hypothetical protein